MSPKAFISGLGDTTSPWKGTGRVCLQPICPGTLDNSRLLPIAGKGTESEALGRAILSVPLGAENCRQASEGYLRQVRAKMLWKVRNQKPLQGRFCPYLSEQDFADRP